MPSTELKAELQFAGKVRKLASSMSHITPKVPHSGSSRETEILPFESHSTLLTAYKWGSSYAKLGSVEIGALPGSLRTFELRHLTVTGLAHSGSIPRASSVILLAAPKWLGNWLCSAILAR